jgi:molybdate transport system substrate-binding protein
VRCGFAVAKENRMQAFHRLALVAAFAVAIIGCSSPAALAQEKTLTVFAAASLKNALDDADREFTARSGIRIVASYAATSALAKQIEAGAPADVFISADEQWMDYAVQHKLVKLDTRFDLLGNKLVLVAAKDSKLGSVTIGNGFDIARLAGDGRIAVADVKAVPAGRYAQAALTKLGAWTAAEKKLAMAENVRAALAYVGRGEAPIGIVYATDAAVEPKVKVIGAFPEGSHPKIIYPVAATATTNKPDVAAYLAFLRGADAKGVFERYGFTVLAKPTS